MKYGKLEGNDFDKLIMNNALNAFRIEIVGNLTLQNMIDQVTDEYEDENGIDTGDSVNILYDSTEDYYSMGEGDITTIDNMEYATDGDAQTTYVSSTSADLQVYSEDTVKVQDIYSLKTIADQTDSLGDYVRRTFSPVLDLSDRETVKFQIRSNRIGTNIQFNAYNQLDSYTKLLIHFDGIDGAQAYTAETGQIVTFIATAQLDTAQKEFGESSLIITENADRVTIPDSANWDFGTSDFTIDCRIRPTSINAYFLIASHYNNASNKWWITIDANNKINLYTEVGNTVVGRYITTSAIPSYNINTWYHIAVVRNGSDLLMFVNGISLEVTTVVPFAGLEFQELEALLYIGNVPDYTFGTVGHIDEFRISKGIARWIENFTVPSLPYSKISSNIVITELNTWETKLIDISSLSNSEKDTIKNIEFKIINADAENTFYIDELYSYTTASGLTLISENTIAEAVPEEGRLIILMEEINTITLNTDLKAYVSRDDGTTFTQITLTDKGDFGNNIKVLYGYADISGQPSDTDMVYKLQTFNSKNCKLHGTDMSWR